MHQLLFQGLSVNADKRERNHVHPTVTNLQGYGPESSDTSWLGHPCHYLICSYFDTLTGAYVNLQLQHSHLQPNRSVLFCCQNLPKQVSFAYLQLQKGSMTISSSSSSSSSSYHPVDTCVRLSVNTTSFNQVEALLLPGKPASVILVSGPASCFTGE